MLSEGMVEEARELAWKNVSTLLPYVRDGIPIVGTEPSCVLSFRDEYLYLLPEDEYAKALAENSFLLTEFLSALEEKGILASLGVAYLNPQQTLAEICELADEAMYRNKRERKQASRLIETSFSTSWMEWVHGTRKS